MANTGTLGIEVRRRVSRRGWVAVTGGGEVAVHSVLVVVVVVRSGRARRHVVLGEDHVGVPGVVAPRDVLLLVVPSEVNGVRPGLVPLPLDLPAEVTNEEHHLTEPPLVTRRGGGDDLLTFEDVLLSGGGDVRAAPGLAPVGWLELKGTSLHGGHSTVHSRGKRLGLDEALDGGGVLGFEGLGTSSAASDGLVAATGADHVAVAIEVQLQAHTDKYVVG